MKMTNFHTHTWRCHHASGSDEEFVLEAIRNGYRTLGFSDHCCWRYDSSYVSGMRMSLSQFESYKDSVLKLKRKYSGQIDILFGMEAEYYPKYMDWMLDFCIDQGIDYLLFGNHYDQSDEWGRYFGAVSQSYLSNYFESCIQGMETGMYAYLAHPELIMRSYDVTFNEFVEEGFHRICQTAKHLDIPLEYNVLGMQYNDRFCEECYPNDRFWKIASQYGNKAIVGMDAHCIQDLDKNLYHEALNRLSKYNVEIISEIEPIDYRKIREKK